MTAETKTARSLAGVKRQVDLGYAKDAVALTQVAANAAAADYTVEDLIALIVAAQDARANWSATGVGGVSRVDAT